MHALCFGFHYTNLALDTTIEALRSGGVDDITWFLHPNRRSDVGPELTRRGIPFHSATVQENLPNAGRPPETPRAEHDLQFLIDRESRFRHAWDRSLALEGLRQRVYDMIRHTDPGVIVFGEVPHAASSYLLYHLAKELEIPTIVIRYGPTPFHVNAVTDIDDRLLDQVHRPGIEAGDPSESSRRYIANLREDYEAARPAYSRDSSSLLARVRSKLRGGGLTPDPRLIAATAAREQLRRDYVRRAVDIDTLDGPIVSVFLHVQPERTTCPEGGRYVQQWLVVSELRSALPDGWKLVVREHPSTFVKGPRLVQTTEFYDAVERLGDTVLASTATSAFDLVDRSECVATVSGTIVFEAAARGTPSLVFGNAVYRGCAGVTDAGGAHGIPDLAALSNTRHNGLPIEQFLAAFDSSPRTWTAEWSPHIDVREIRNSGHAFSTLLPDALSMISD